jgi:hypothetical protein
MYNMAGRIFFSGQLLANQLYYSQALVITFRAVTIITSLGF